MSARDDIPGGSSWRGAGPEEAVPAAGAPNSWRQMDAPATQRGPGFWHNSRWQKLFRGILSTISLLVTGGFIIYLWQLPGCTRTELIVASVADYSDCRIPARIYAANDERALTELQGPLVKVVPRLQQGEDFRKQLRPDEKKSLLVVYFASIGGMLTQGGISSEQQAGFFWRDSHPDEPANSPNSPKRFETLKALFADLKALPPQRPKLLLLDLNEVQTNWRLGLLENWSDEMITPDEVKGVPGLTVITASSPGERSWTGNVLGSQPSGRSVFAHFLVEGLKGAANPAGGGRVSLRQLYDYVEENTNLWVSRNRHRGGQHPQLLASPAAGLEQLFVSSPPPSPNSGAESSPDNASADWNKLNQQLDACWAAREKLGDTSDDLFRPRAAYHFDPLSWRYLTQVLLRAEEYRRARSLEPARKSLKIAQEVLDRLQRAIDQDVLRQMQDYPFVAQGPVRWIDGENASDTAPLNPATHLAQALQQEVGQNYLTQIRAAVDLRRQAEQAACGPLGTEIVVPAWRLAADNARRKSEDRLIIGDQPADVTRLQDQAQQQYQRILAVRQTFHELQCVRNRLLAELPELAVWAAFRAPQVQTQHRQEVFETFRTAWSASSDRQPTLQQLDQVASDSKSLDRVHTDLLGLFLLSRDVEVQLEAWSTGQEISDKTLAEARTLLEQVRQRVQHLREVILAEAESASQRLRQPQPDDWRKLETLLSYPELPEEYRTKLNRLHESYSTTLQTGFETESRKGGEVASAVPAEPEADSRPARARWHALWAIQALSQGPHGLRSDESLWQKWAELPRESDPAFLRRITILGDDLRLAFIDNRAQLDLERSREDRGSATTSSELSSDENRRQLSVADRKSRCYLDECAVAEFAGTFNPTATLRRHQFAQLLLQLGQRYQDDFWKDWYDKAVAQCLEAASKLNVSGLRSQISEAKARFTQRLSAHARLTAQPVVFGSNDSTKLAIQVKYSDVPPGDARLTLDLPAGRGLMRLGNSGMNEVTFEATAGGGIADKSVGMQLGRDTSVTSASPALLVTPQIYYRGHRWEEDVKSIRIEPARLEGLLFTRLPDPDMGRVEVEGFEQPVILLILDCSKSMNTPVENDLTRFHFARKVLNMTLDELAARQGKNLCRMGLIVYGDQAKNNNPKLLRPVAAINQNLAELKADLALLKAEGNTPLLTAIRDASILLAGENAQATKTIIAITDGVYGEDARMWKQVSADLKQAAGTGVELTMIGFDLPQPNQEEQLKLDHMKAISDFKDARKPNQLDQAIKAAVRIREYTLTPLSSGGLERPQGRKYSLGTASDELPPGKYQLSIRGAAPMDIELSGGDDLRFGAQRSRLVHYKPKSIRYEARTSDPRQVTFVCRSFTEDTSVKIADFKFSLTNTDESRTVTHPAEMHIEVLPLRDTRLRSHEIEIQPGETVPTWHVVVHDWPAREGAVANALWKMSRTPSDLVLAWRELEGQSRLKVSGLPLQLLRSGYDPERRTASLELQLPETSAATEESLAELQRMRFELSRNNEFLNLRTQREYIAKEGKLIVKFQLPESLTFSPDWSLQVTSWNSLRNGAEKLELPLKIEETDLQF